MEQVIMRVSNLEARHTAHSRVQNTPKMSFYIDAILSFCGAASGISSQLRVWRVT
jgi:hypothetical protein